MDKQYLTFCIEEERYALPVENVRAVIESIPQAGEAPGHAILKGIGQQDGRFVLIVDLEQALSADRIPVRNQGADSVRGKRG